MIVLNIFIGIALAIAFIVMMSLMIILERDKPKNIIIWSCVFVSTQIIGYVIYLSIRKVFYKKRNSLNVKLKEDEIYAKLISNKLNNNGAESSHEVFTFNNLAFNTQTTFNNNYEIIHDYLELKQNLIEDLSNAKKYILFELTKFNAKDFEDIKEVLIEKANANVTVKLVHDGMISFSLIKQLKESDVKVYRFSKHNTVGKVYSNLRNVISIDGEIAYIANINLTKRQLEGKKETAHTFIKLKGDIVQDVDVQTHKDTIFASGKFIQYHKHDAVTYKNNNQIQFVSNDANTDLELSLIKAICMAKNQSNLNCLHLFQQKVLCHFCDLQLTQI